jgi:hypothetical protein
MCAEELIARFMTRAADDPMIGPSHIGVYLAIVLAEKRQCPADPVLIHRRPVMRQAKLRGEMTYHKCMRDLQRAGYIRYVPSYDPRAGTLVFLLDHKEKVKSEWNESCLRTR